MLKEKPNIKERKLYHKKENSKFKKLRIRTIQTKGRNIRLRKKAESTLRRFFAADFCQADMTDHMRIQKIYFTTLNFTLNFDNLIQ